MRISSLVLIFILLLSCSHNNKKEKIQAESGQNLDNLGLTYQESLERSHQISNLKIDFTIHIDENPNTFQGESTLTFDYKKTDSDIRIDAKNMNIKSIVLNGLILSSYKQTKEAIFLNRDLFVEGKQKLVISYVGQYSKTGSGFYRYVDQEDKKVYFYTDFEPFEASQLFPCFDQPNLKAQYKISVVAPKAMKAISNYPVESKKILGDKILTKFGETSKFSTYLVALHVGDFYEFSSSFKNKNQNIPLKLYVRQTLKKHVKENFWFNVTKEGFSYYQRFFDFNYPYPKYDQIIVPDFNSGAMENVGAVTFSESYVKRSELTYKEKESLASVILHEMAHMWFGNLVTMEWWDGLWLNESFATWMSYKALYEQDNFKNVWISFFKKNKIAAFEADQLSTSHPINSEVLNTSEAFNNFDSITYGKGASVLKQLEFFVGSKPFQEGLKNYFKKFQYKNTSLNDFLSEISQASGKPLDLWADLWLKNIGFDRISIHSQCVDGVLKTMQILSSPTIGNSERIHASKIGLFYLEKNKLKLKHTFNSTFQVRNYLDEASGLKCPDLVVTNLDDYDFTIQLVDPLSLFTIKKNYSQIESALTRLTLNYALWDMTLNLKLNTNSFKDYYLQALTHEMDSFNLDFLFKIADRLIYLDDNNSKLASEIENIAIAKLSALKVRSDKLQVLDHLLRFARTQKTMEYFENIYINQSSLLDADRKWSVLISLCSLNHPHCEQFVKSLSHIDKTDLARKNSLIALSRTPTRKNKEDWLQKILNESDLSLTEKIRLAYNIFPLSQSHLKVDLSHLFFEQMLKISEKYPPEFLEAFATGLSPLNCTLYAHEQLDRYLGKNRIHPIILKPLKEELDEDMRCLNLKKSVK